MIKRGKINGKTVYEGISDDRVTKNIYKMTVTENGLEISERKDDGTVTSITPTPTPTARDRVREIIESATAFYSVVMTKDGWSINNILVRSSGFGEIRQVIIGNNDILFSKGGYSLFDIGDRGKSYLIAMNHAFVEIYDDEEDPIPSNATKEEVLAAYDALED